ncbi:MAG: hypothetical protein Q7T18_03170, partial [Sedimentisphaerales bacterium]|nr:hypothetical protein [Sedimentisphaerales bacterium]
AFAGGLGIEADLRGLPVSDDCSRIDAQLFSESNARYIVEVEPDKYDAFSKAMLNVPCGHLGSIIDNARLIVKAKTAKTVIDIDLDTLKAAWQQPLKW